jgi:hypothetical protein
MDQRLIANGLQTASRTKTHANSPLKHPISKNSPPYTFFLLNGDMELHRNRHLFIQKMFYKPKTSLEKTSITAFLTMNDRSPSIFFTYRASIHNPYIR